MYKLSDKLQHSFFDFNQPMGLQMNPDNRWIKMADRIPWDEFKIKYADRELVEQITENPYLQYFIGLPGYQEEAPFDTSTLVLFRKRISAEMLMEANEYLLAHKDDDKNNNTPPSAGNSDDAPEEKTGNHHLPFLQVIWSAVAKALQQTYL